MKSTQLLIKKEKVNHDNVGEYLAALTEDIKHRRIKKLNENRMDTLSQVKNSLKDAKKGRIMKKEKTIFNDVETRLNAVLDDLKHKRVIKRN